MNKDVKATEHFFMLSSAEGILCFLYLLFLPGGSGEGSLFAFSRVRLALLSAVLLLACFFGIPLVSKNVLNFWIRLSAKKTFRLFALLLSQGILLSGTALLRSLWLLYRTSEDYSWFVVYRRLFPPVCWLGFIAIQAILYFLYRISNDFREVFRQKSYQRKTFLILMGIGIVAAVGIAVTRIGLVKDNAFFGKPTVPLLEWHLILAFLLCLLWIILEMKQIGKAAPVVIKAMPFIVWAVAVGIWLAIPNQHGFFSPPGRAPNFEVYPFSDGSFYGHYARSLAAGMGFKGRDIPPRPLYIVLLAIFHLLIGNQYDSVILLQTLVLGILPALIYLIGKELHSIGAGLAAALLCILRETNSILSAPFAHNVSTTKYFFADLPTALAAAFFVLMLIRWLKAQREDNYRKNVYAVLTGGALGMMTLIRTQSLSLIFVPLAFLFIRTRKQFSRRFSQFILFTAALCCCLFPWLIRNKQITGKFVFDHPATQTAEMAISYNIGGTDLTNDEGMNEGEYSEKLTRSILTSVKQYPKEIATFITAHFVNNEICNLRLFPLRDRLSRPMELIKPTTPFWEEINNDQLSIYNLIFLALSYALLAFGISASMESHMREGLVPLAVILLFNLSTAIGRYSAGRYLIPVDWIIFLYGGIGIAEWLYRSFRLSGFTPPQTSNEETEREAAQFVQPAKLHPKRKLGLYLGIFIAIGLSLPLSERIIPMRFEPASREAVLSKLEVDPNDYDTADAVVMKAIAIYPRYYAAGEGEPESAKQGYGVSDYGRLIFLTLSPGGFGTIELRTETVPAYFPDNSEIWMVGHSQGATTVADLILVQNGDRSYRYTADSKSK
jgi:hypothetical protein